MTKTAVNVVLSTVLSTVLKIPIDDEVLKNFKDSHIFIYKGNCVSLIDKKDNIPGFIGLSHACLLIGIKEGLSEFYVVNSNNISIKKNNELTRINSSVKLSSGTHGSVHLLTYFNVAVKIFEDSFIMAIELAVYELIQKMYPDPESKGLPKLLGYGKNFIIVPNYTRVMKFNESKEVYTGVAEAIYNLHSLGILHRDIKFSNIMIHRGRPILLDFGLSTWSVFTTHRSPATSIQTMWFRAPEIAMDTEYNYPTLPSSDWWSYGVILASKKKMMLTSMTNDALIEDLRVIFNGEKFPQTLESNEFLCLDPVERMDGATFLNLPPISSKMMLNTLPIFDRLYTRSTDNLFQMSSSWAVYFGAVDYFSCLSENDSIELSSCLFGGSTDELEVLKSYQALQGEFFRLNTFSILAMFYSLETIVKHCYILSISGVNFPHINQAQWIKDYFINGIEDTFPEIKKVYYKNATLFNIDKAVELGSI